MPTPTQALAELLLRGNAVFFGGAGVSTESGIPDFRSESGLYAAQQVYGHPPEELLSHTFFVKKPELFFRYYRENLVSLTAKPNAAHLALAELEARGLLRAVVTQNIDGLHQAAGSREVLELHGSNLRQYCPVCGAKYSLEYVMNSETVIPKCEKCGGTVRPDVVLYEEGLDDAVMSRAIDFIAGADTLIVGGTSLVVYPAAGLLRYFRGKNLVLINKSATRYDDEATLALRAPIGETLGAVMQLLAK
jgi:NAD-dependent deacetylase